MTEQSTKLLTERLRAARVAANLTQEEVAESLGMARTTLVAIEAGQRRVRSEELIGFADLYKTTVGDLLKPASISFEALPQFRREWSAVGSSAESSELLRLLLKAANSVLDLEARLGRTRQVRLPPETPLAPGRLQEQADDLALETRTRLGLGLAPIPDPIDVFEQEGGLRLFFFALPPRTSAAFVFSADVGGCALVNSAHPRTRQAWSVTHEYAHLLTTRATPEVYFLDSSEKPPSEKFADLFAASFLMPAVTLRRRFEEAAARGRFSPRDLVLLAHHFHVSTEAVARRLEALRLLPRGTYDSLRRRDFKPEEIAKELGLSELPAMKATFRTTLTVVEALEESLITEGQAAEVLMLSRGELRRVVDALLTSDNLLGK